MSFEHRTRVRFADVDAAGIVFFARYFDWAHDAYEEWLRAIGSPLAKILAAGEIGTPLVRTEASYARPVKHDDELLVTLRGVDVGGTSASFFWDFTAAETGATIATVVMKHACVDLRRFAARPWPDEMLHAFRAAGPASPAD